MADKDRSVIDDAEGYLRYISERQVTSGLVPTQLIQRLITHAKAVERRNEILAKQIREMELHAAGDEEPRNPKEVA